MTRRSPSPGSSYNGRRYDSDGSESYGLRGSAAGQAHAGQRADSDGAESPRAREASAGTNTHGRRFGVDAAAVSLENVLTIAGEPVTINGEYITVTNA